jgi:hypothetical protein
MKLLAKPMVAAGSRSHLNKKKLNMASTVVMIFDTVIFSDILCPLLNYLEIK